MQYWLKAIGVSVLFSACASNNMLPPDPPMRGIGEPCGASTDCRAGLRCGATNRCEPRGDIAMGQTCRLTGDCMPGLICGAESKCVPAGTTLPGGTCSSTSDCVRGAVCYRAPGELVGTCLIPRGAGTVTLSDGGMVGNPETGDDGGTSGGDGGMSSGIPRDIGGRCQDVLDCQPGLLCDPTVNTCQLSSTVGMRTLFRGVACGMDSAAPKAYFELPNAEGAPTSDFFRLPFPNDARRDPMTTRINLRGFPTPGTGLLGFDVVDRYARASEQDLDGFGANQWVYFRFSTQPDFATLQLGSTIKLVDLTTGQPLGYQTYRFDGNQGKYICANWLGVTTAAGVPFAAGHTIAVILTTGIHTAGAMSRPFERDADFNAVMGAMAPAMPTQMRAWQAYAPLRTYLQMQNIDPSTILNAAVFTVQNPHKRMQGIRDAINAGPMSTAEGFVRCAEGVVSPCDDGLMGANHVRGCIGAADPAFDEYQGTIDVPLLQSGTRPYRMPTEGAIAYNAMGQAMPQGRERVCVSITVPRGQMMPMGGWPVVLYAHGTGGNFRSGITEGLAQSLSDVTLEGDRHVRFATVSFDGVMHGRRRGEGVNDSPNVLFFNFANPNAARDNVLQGGADVLALGRAIRSLTIMPSGMGAAPIQFDASKVIFLGHSQGSTVGAPAIAFEPNLAGMVFSGAGGDLRLSLTTKTNPVNIAGLTPLLLGEAAGAEHPALQLFQAFIESADAVNYGLRLTLDRPMGVPLRPFVMTYGLGDTFSTPATMQAFATSMSIPAAAPIPGGMNQWPAGMGIPLPAMNNYSTGMGSTTGVLLEADPMGMYDGHFVLFRDMTLRQRVLGFIGTASEGMAVVR